MCSVMDITINCVTEITNNDSDITLKVNYITDMSQNIRHYSAEEIRRVFDNI